jgi:hypothetical protein
LTANYSIEDAALGASSVLNLLAFLFHTTPKMFDKTYRRIRDDLPTRKTFFDDIRALTRYMCFDSREVMLTFMARGLELELPDTS